MNALRRSVLAIASAILAAPSFGYEINNHADMSEQALLFSQLGREIGPAGKAFRVGLNPADGTNPANARQISTQKFALKQIHPFGSELGPIPYCFGSTRPAPFMRVTIPFGDPGYPRTQLDTTIEQPFKWDATSLPKLTVAQMVRYGACYEDEEHPDARSISHFYNPQVGGDGVTKLGLPLAASSLHWILNPSASPTTISGVNHYTWPDARNAFYYAVTSNNPALTAQENANYRETYWGQTFQALGHMVHHLQDMGSPQHVRSDDHCNSEQCRLGWKGWVGAYRPSGYEAFFERNFNTVKGLAGIATTPMLFGLPREFWNMNTSNSLNTTNTTRYMAANEGLAAYTSTNFPSVGKDFLAYYDYTQTSVQYRPAVDLQFPRPSGTFNDVNVASLFPPENLPALNSLCGGSTANCVMQFMGTDDDPTAKSSAVSVFAKSLLVPRDPNHPDLPTYTGKGVFTQNFFTYADAGTKLIPKAVQYSAGLIDYFFRGEIDVRPTADTMYALLDGGDTGSTCKDSCGFKKIKLIAKNTTEPINNVPQDMTNGTLRAVVRFSRNNCYVPNWTGDPGQLNDFEGGAISACLLNGGDKPLEEIVLSTPVAISSLAAGSEQTFTFDFSAQPIPINAWNLNLQLVFRGNLGAEENAVVVSTVPMSAPTVFTFTNEYNYAVVNGHLYTIEQIDASPTLLSQLVPAARTAPVAEGGRVDYNYFFQWQRAFFEWQNPNGTVLALVDGPSGVPLGGLASLIALGDPRTLISAKVRSRGVTNSFGTAGRKLQWDYAAPSPAAALDYVWFWRYRGRHTTMWFPKLYQGSADTTQPPVEEFQDRATFSPAAPVPMTSFNF